MRRIKLITAYDGTDFCGWQIQQNGRTVQGEIERALQIIHKHPVRLYGSGRTDAGVHAEGQTAHFDTDISSMTAQQFLPALSRLLPGDIRVVASEHVDEKFHARFSAKSRRYRYVLRTPSTVTYYTSRYCSEVRRLPDIARMNSYARLLVGTHDFSTFAAAGDTSESKIRRINQACWHMERGAAVFTVSGNAFLWKMVRSVVGTMLELEGNDAPPEEFAERLASRNRNRSGVTAPARGLVLERVRYE
ncbi:MAG: tRNA pseudouridine(38-40) synthase TruA [Spirochaetota bacterium]